MKKLVFPLIVLLIISLTICSGASTSYADEYVSLPNIPSNYERESLNTTGGLLDGAQFFEVDENGVRTGNNFIYNVDDSNTARVTAEELAEDESSVDEFLATIEDAAVESGYEYTILSVEDTLTTIGGLECYNINLTCEITYLFSTFTTYQSTAVVPVNDLTFTFVYTSFESMAEAQGELALLMDGATILVEPDETGFVSTILVVLIPLLALIGVIVLIVVLVHRKRENKTMQAAPSIYANTQSPNMQPPYGQNPNMQPPYGQNPNMQQPYGQNPPKND